MNQAVNYCLRHKGVETHYTIYLHKGKKSKRWPAGTQGVAYPLCDKCIDWLKSVHQLIIEDYD